MLHSERGQVYQRFVPAPPLLPGAAGLIPYVLASNGQWSLQACSFAVSGGGLLDHLLRASNEALPRVHVPRAGGRPGHLPLQSAEGGMPRDARGRTLPLS